VISTHVLDTERGRPVSGVRVELYRGHELVAAKETDSDGRIRELADAAGPATYRLVFRPVSSPFFKRIEFEVTLDDTGDLHVPLLLSSYSCTSYRGS
jgi:5-hydroxyisourate hydrolase-like protein (transthyretin family)